MEKKNKKKEDSGGKKKKKWERNRKRHRSGDPFCEIPRYCTQSLRIQAPKTHIAGIPGCRQHVAATSAHLDLEQVRFFSPTGVPPGGIQQQPQTTQVIVMSTEISRKFFVGNTPAQNAHQQLNAKVKLKIDHLLNRNVTQQTYALISPSKPLATWQHGNV